MKWSEIVNLASSYSYVTESDEYSEVKYGCDCGCGGDYYEDNPEAWDSMIEFNAETLAEVKKFCEENGIEYDGLD